MIIKQIMLRITYNELLQVTKTKGVKKGKLIESNKTILRCRLDSAYVCIHAWLSRDTFEFV